MLKKFLCVGSIVGLVMLYSLNASALGVKGGGSFQGGAAETTNDSTISSGMHKVGEDILAGEYIIFASGSSGYFCVSSDSNQDDILFNGNFDYSSIITVNDGEYLELERCYAVPFDEVGEIDLTGDGMFKVGTHIPAGEYKLESEINSGYYCIYSDSRQQDIIANDNFEGQNYVTVSDGEYLVLDRCKFLVPPQVSKNDIENRDDNEIQDKIMTSMSISERDFIVNGAEVKEDENLYQEMIHENQDIRYFFYISGVDESPESVLTTYRGINIGTTKKQVFEKYGIAKEIFFTENDIMYEYLKNNDEEIIAQILRGQCDYYVAYDWLDKGQIVFYFDSNNCVSWVVYSLGARCFDTYETDAEIIMLVQQALNERGHYCGTPDGIAGVNTKNAILEFQKNNNLFESGVIDASLLKALSIITNNDYSEVDGEESIPQNIITDEAEWENWKSTGRCMLFPFMQASDLLDFSWGNPQKDGSHVWVECSEGNGDFGMYYCADNQRIMYVGLYTDNINVFSSEAFRNACVKLIRSYNIHFEDEEVVFNLQEERAGEIVDFALNNTEHCLADNMRIRVIKNEGEYSFHVEY